MFADSMLETSWAQRKRRGWMTLTSFGLEAIAIAVLLTIPLLETVGLPLARTVSMPVIMGRHEPGPTHPPDHFRSSAVEIVPYSGRLMAPGRIPDKIPLGDDSTSSEPSLGDVFTGDTGRSFDPGIVSNLPISGTRPVMPAPAPATITRAFRTSSMLQGSLIRRVEPVYPPMARIAHVQGSVVLEAVISKEGTMEKLRLVSGHPMLVPAAIDAVSQWRYKPYVLNGDAIEVETQITVNFILGVN